MATQVSYPGIYVQEFTPGAPIQGVGTNTGAFIGTAQSGPVDTPTEIFSWDEFQNIFGGFVANPPLSYLPAAVYGFFLNGGTQCFIVRHGIGAHATANLDSRPPGVGPELVATAIAEGTIGNNLSAQVVDSSRLGSMLQALALPQTLTAQNISTNVTSLDATRTKLVVTSNTGFAPGDRLQVKKGANTATGIVQSTQGPDTIIFSAPLAGAWNPAGGTARIDDLQPGQTTFRVIVPAGLVLSQALPAGALISITLGGTTEIQTVRSAGGDTITLTSPLANAYSLAGPGFPQIASLEFDLKITNASTGKTEAFAFLSMNPLNPGYWGTAVTSQLLTLANPPAPPAPMPSDPRPKAAIYNLGGGTDDDRATALAQIVAAPNTYLNLLNPYPVELVCVPGVTDSNVQSALVSYCELKQDRFAILDAVRDKKPGFDDLLVQYGQVRSAKGYAAIYYPWIQVVNPLNGQTEFWPPSGHVMGVYARTDAQRGVHKAPANEAVFGSLGVERRLTDQEQGPLNLLGIDILRVFPEQAEPLVWGARTTSTDSNWQYVNIRRLFIYVEQSIEQGIRWAVFEPNNLQLWQKLKRTITEFLTRVWQDGALFGAKATDAFYVRIDDALNPPSTQALGQLFIEVGLRPAYPAEFIILRIGIWQGGSQVTES